jgi:hypothetical protein
MYAFLFVTHDNRWGRLFERVPFNQAYEVVHRLQREGYRLAAGRISTGNPMHTFCGWRDLSETELDALAQSEQKMT